MDGHRYLVLYTLVTPFEEKWSRLHKCYDGWSACSEESDDDNLLHKEPASASEQYFSSSTSSFSSSVMEMPSHTKESSDGDTKGLELLGRSAMRKAVVVAAANTTASNF